MFILIIFEFLFFNLSFAATEVPVKELVLKAFAIAPREQIVTRVSSIDPDNDSHLVELCVEGLLACPTRLIAITNQIQRNSIVIAAFRG
jgi:hypothetical protein